MFVAILLGWSYHEVPMGNASSVVAENVTDRHGLKRRRHAQVVGAVAEVTMDAIAPAPI